MMRIAFAIVKYFPSGGAQRDCFALASLLAARGHQITIFTSVWQGERPDGVLVEEIPVRAATNHGLNLAFSRAFLARIEHEKFDGTVGFNKLAGLDIYFVADICLAPSVTGIKRFLPRYRILLALEEQVFGPASDTFHLFLTKTQANLYASEYGVRRHGSKTLPPLLDTARQAPKNRKAIRQRIRTEIGVPADASLIVSVATQYEIKGVDRVLDVLPALDHVRYLVVGLSRTDKFRAAVKRLGLKDRVVVLGHREDIMNVLSAADLMVHPARKENTGAVILESLVAGIPVVCTEVCGNAEFVSRSGAGIVIPEPFDRNALMEATKRALSAKTLQALSKRADNFQKNHKSFDGRETAVKTIIAELERRNES